MKKFLFLMTAIVIMVNLVLSTAVMADDDSYFTFKKTALDYVESGKTIQIDVIATQSFETPAYNLRVEYDADLWAISSITTGGGKEVAGGKNVVAITTGTFDAEDMVAVEEGDTVLKFKIKALKDDASFGTSTFRFALANILNEEMDGYAYEMSDFGATVTVTDTRVFATAEDISVAVEDAAYTAVKGVTETYTGVWVGSAAKELEGKTLTAAKLVFGDDVKTFAIPVDEVGGNGSVAFKIAVLGVPKAEGTTTPAYDAAVVLTVE